METALVIGLGEIGRAIFSIMKDTESIKVYGLDADETKMRALRQNRAKISNKIDIIHICLPCKDKDSFSNTVTRYVDKFKPRLVIINSTVPPGTTKDVYSRCKCLLAHSPCRGVHKSEEHMVWELKRWTKYVGGVNRESTEEAAKHLRKMKLKVKTVKSCSETELAKLFETTYRAWMIACFQEMHRISINFKADFDDIVDFLEDTHRVRRDRPIMFPSVIGGHCLIPNTELLRQAYDSDFLKLILDSNEKRKSEMTNKAAQDEVAKIAARVQKLEKDFGETQEECN